MFSCNESSLTSRASLLLLLLIIGTRLSEAYVTSNPAQSTSSSGSSMRSADNGISRKSMSSNMDEEQDDDEDEFSTMMQGVEAAAAAAGVGSAGQTVYVIEFETEADKASGGVAGTHHNRGGKDMSDESSDGQSPLDPWSIVWYIGSFGGLIAFFLIVSCSEWCCRRGARPLNIPYTQRGEVINAQAANQGMVTESPPPPYHLFAPPPYDSVNYVEIANDKAQQPASAEKLDIYVISLPIQAAPAQPPPA